METVPTQSLSPPQAARALLCSLCWQRPGEPCQRDPDGDHLARYLDAYDTGAISRADMTEILIAAEVVTKWRMIVAVTS